MNLSDITPMILTLNERENIGRCLDGLHWASQILVVDSLSTDETPAICQRYPKVKLVSRAFDSFAQQCNFGLSQITTPWILSLDADYLVSADLAGELRELVIPRETAAYFARFSYCVFGRPLTGTLYPARIVLCRKEGAHYIDDGHAHRFQIAGQAAYLQSRMFHDDRKPLSRWFTSQYRYACEEAEKLSAFPPGRLRRTDKIRQWRVVAPFANLLFVLFIKGVIWDGRAGWYYAAQRLIAELMISACLLDRDLRPPTGNETGQL